MHRHPAFAKAGGRFRAVIRIRTVKTTLVARELRAVDPGLEVPPHHMAVAALKPDIELTAGRRILIGRRIVAVNRIEVIGVQTAQQLARVFLIEVIKDIRELFIPGIQRRRQQILALDLTFDIARRAPARVKAVAVVFIKGFNPFVQIKRPANRKVCETDIEPFILRNENIAREVQALVRLIQHRNLNRARTRFNDLLGDEVPINPERNLSPERRDRMSFGDVITIDGHCPAMDRDIAHRRAIIAIAGKLRKGRFRTARIIDTVLGLRYLQRQWQGLVKAAITIINPQGIDQVLPESPVIQLLTHSLGRAPERLPFFGHRNRFDQIAFQIQNTHLALRNPVGIVPTAEELDIGLPRHQTLNGFGGDVQKRLNIQPIELDLNVHGFKTQILDTLAIFSTARGRALTLRRTGDRDRIAIHRDPERNCALLSAARCILGVLAIPRSAWSRRWINGAVVIGRPAQRIGAVLGDVLTILRLVRVRTGDRQD